MIWLITVFVLVVVFLLFLYSIIIPRVKGLPVLLYHKVSEDTPDDLTVTTPQLRQHFRFISENGFNPVTAADVISFIEDEKYLPDNPILITFDDGFVNNIEFAYPLLKEYDLRATIFLPTAYLGKTGSWEIKPEKVLSVEQLKAIDPQHIELALHSHSHKNYKEMPAMEIEKDLNDNINTLTMNNINFTRAFAYPFGGRPRDLSILKSMQKTMQSLNIKIAFRIGNRVNKIPFTDVYELKRIDIKGTDSFFVFKTKLAKGRFRQL